MSTRQSRKSTPVPHTPSSGSSRSRARDGSESPISPTRFSRLQEKTELQNLNDRLACYIDKVRSLEIENSKLTKELKTIEEFKRTDVMKLQDNYEDKIKNLTRALNHEGDQKARLELEKASLTESNKELSSKFEHAAAELAKLHEEIGDQERAINDLTTRCNHLTSDNRKLKQELNEVTKDRNRIKKLLEEKTKQLEEEILFRIRLQNNLQSMEEKVTFAENLYHSTINETSRIHRHLEISEVDSTPSKSEWQLQELERVRAEFRDELKNKKEEISKMYEEKVSFLEKELTKKSALAQDALISQRKHLDIIEELRGKVTDLENKIRDLERINGALESAVHEEKSLRATENDAIRKQLDSCLADFQDLMDIKISLDMELAAYKQLLEGEERRLNYTPNTSRSNALNGYEDDESTEFRGGKRKRGEAFESGSFSSTSEITVNRTSVSDIEIGEVSQEGVYVKIHNKGTKEIPVGSWQIVRSAGDKNVMFKLHHTVKLEAGGTITVWSMDSSVTHEPPHNIVMKNQKWPVADDMETTLYNSKNEEMAKVTQKKENRIREIVHSRHSYGRPSTSSNGVQDDKCVIM